MSLAEYFAGLTWAFLGTRLLIIAAVWAVVFLLIRYLSKAILGLDRRVEMIEIDPRQMWVIERLIFYGGLLLGGVTTIAVLGLTQLLYSTLTAAGVISVIIGFAIKDIVANFFSGILIMVEQPFVKGDFIEIGNFSGTVRRVSLRSTEIVALEGPIVTIPNSLIATEAVINYSTAPGRRIEIRVAVPNDSNVSLVTGVLHDVVKNDPRVQIDPAYMVTVEDIREYAVDLMLACYAGANEWLQVRSDLRQRILEEFQRRHLELAVPLRKHLYANLAAMGVAGAPSVYDDVEVTPRAETLLQPKPYEEPI
jgi:small conductance mechanosensitive channel